MSKNAQFSNQMSNAVLFDPIALGRNMSRSRFGSQSPRASSHMDIASSHRQSAAKGDTLPINQTVTTSPGAPSRANQFLSPPGRQEAQPAVAKKINKQIAKAVKGDQSKSDYFTNVSIQQKGSKQPPRTTRR